MLGWSNALELVFTDANVDAECGRVDIHREADDMAHRYELGKMREHSRGLALHTRKTLPKEMASVANGFRTMDYHFEALAKKPKSLLRNVKMALTVRFTNHIFSQLMLIERGLILDAVNCGRSATETTAFYWLVCRDDAAAGLYDVEESPRPIEIRRKLERLGVDVAKLRDDYSLESSIAHVGNKYDHFQIRWTTPSDGEFLIGGGPNRDLQAGLLRGISAVIGRFFLHDPDYVVAGSDT